MRTAFIKTAMLFGHSHMMRVSLLVLASQCKSSLVSTRPFSFANLVFQNREKKRETCQTRTLKVLPVLNYFDCITI